MTFPAGLPVVTVTGLHLVSMDGQPLAGSIVFTPSGQVADPALSAMLEGSAVGTVTNGVMAPVTLPATDCVTPGFTYTVTQRLSTADGIEGGPLPATGIEIPSGLAPSVDLSALLAP